LRGETDLSLAAAQRLLELQHDVEGPRRRTVMQMLLLHQARLSAVLGDTVRLRRIAAELQAVGPLGTDGPASAQHELLAAYLADADGHRQQAVHIRRRALQNDALLWRLGLGVETRLRLAADLLRQGDFAGAAEAVRAAQRDTDDGTELAPVLLAGPAVLDTLAQAHWQQQLDDPARARLRRWAEHAQRLRRQPAVPAATTPQPLGGLSPREFEVLQRIAAGDSNKLIARAFDLSPHTVKRHVANILDKLGLQSRGQAAAWLHAQQP
jgi:LuxR family maltose regulon positive regulatory protein